MVMIPDDPKAKQRFRSNISETREIIATIIGSLAKARNELAKKLADKNEHVAEFSEMILDFANVNATLKTIDTAVRTQRKKSAAKAMIPDANEKWDRAIERLDHFRETYTAVFLEEQRRATQPPAFVSNSEAHEIFYDALQSLEALSPKERELLQRAALAEDQGKADEKLFQYYEEHLKEASRLCSRVAARVPNSLLTADDLLSPKRRQR